jgi:hypothetical protein
LLPVAKVQFERFLAEEHVYDDLWYEQVLAVNPRMSWRQFRNEEREQLFLTGVSAEEALAFARWLGDDHDRFDLPTVDEWRAVDDLLRRCPVDEKLDRRLGKVSLHRAARSIIADLRERAQPRNWRELTLMRSGLLEWARCGNGEEFGGVGRTRPQFLRSVFNPQRDEPVKPFDQRSPYFGVRLVQR